MSATPRILRLLAGRYAVRRLPANAPVPAWVWGGTGEFTSVTRTRDELSVICSVDCLPETAGTEPGWDCLRLEGAFGLDEPGVLASVVAPLAEAGMSVFAVATYDTDYLLVRNAARAAEALRRVGHEVRADGGP